MTRFIPNFSDQTTPLRELIKKGVVYEWKENHQQALNLLKNELTGKDVMMYFNPVLQENNAGYLQLITYISHALTKYKTKYSQTEKKSSGLVWGIDKLPLYLHHTNFDVIVDHMPLTFIFDAKNRRSPRVERWQIKLQGYSFDVIYKKGSKNIAYFISRIHANNIEGNSKVTERHVNFVTNNAVPYSMSINEIIQESLKDDTITRIKHALCSNKWDGCKNCHKFAHELCESNDLLLRLNKIFIPASLHQKILNFVLKLYLGISEMKSLLRSKVHWFSIDKDIEDLLLSVHRVKNFTYQINLPQSK